MTMQNREKQGERIRNLQREMDQLSNPSENRNAPVRSIASGSSRVDRERLLQNKERHKQLFIQRRHTFYETFTVEQQEQLEQEMQKWPCYRVGIPLPGIHSKIIKILGLAHGSSTSHEIVQQWLESVGWSIVGRHSWVDETGTVWGPSPYSEVPDQPFPYSRGFYDKNHDLWLLNKDDPCYPTFRIQDELLNLKSA